MDSKSEELRKAARSGFISVFEHLIEDESLQEIVEECFDESAVWNLFLNWNAAWWIDISGMEAEDLIGSDEVTHAKFLNSARQATFEAMKTMYECKSEENLITAKYAMHHTLECRKRLHEDVMRRLEAPGLTDQIGLEALFPKFCFEDCDKVLRLLYPTSGYAEFADELAALDELAKRDSPGMDSFETTLILLFSYHCAMNVNEAENCNVFRTVALTQPSILAHQNSVNEQLAVASEDTFAGIYASLTYSHGLNVYK